MSIRQPSKRYTPLARSAIVIAALSLGARLGALHWLGDLLALLADTFVWVSLLVLLGCVRLRAWRWSLVAGAALLLSGQQVTDFARVAPPAQPVAQRSLRILVHNIYYQNESLGAVVDAIRQHDPDIVLLMEYSDAIQQQIESSFDDYPYRVIQPSRLTMGLALFSRIPIESAEVHRQQATRIPVYEVRMRLGGRLFTMVGGHPWPPQPQWGQLHRDQMQELIRVASGVEQPLIVAGDFNAAPWSYTMRQLAERARVRQVRQLLDLQKTWHPLPLLGLPLDHVLVSDAWEVLSATYGVPAGSDHLSLIVDLRLRE